MKPAGINSFAASYFNGGWVSLCDGPCNVTNGKNMVDFVRYTGTTSPPGLPPSVGYSGVLDGIDNSAIQNAFWMALLSIPSNTPL